MPDINALLEQSSKKKFKKSTYRPWNYMEEIEKEDEEKQKEEFEKSSEQKYQHSDILTQPSSTVNYLDNTVSDRIQEPSLKSLPIPLHYQVNDDNCDKISDKNIKIELTKELVYEPVTINPLYLILRLSGHQKAIFEFILERCLSRGLLSTGMVSGEILTSITNTSLSMVNTSIQRIINKKLVYRENGKRGRGGFYCFSITQEVKDAAIEYRRLNAFEQNEISRLNEGKIESYDPIKIENRKSNIFNFPKEWEEIDIEPLHHIGFSRSHLIQLYKQGGFDSQSVQESIYYFAYDLKYNNKASAITKSSPIGYFMGILKRSLIYTAPENYESPKDRALRELLERKRSEKQKRDVMVKELADIEFPEWRKKLPKDEIEKILPPEILKANLPPAISSVLRAYYIENILIPKLEE